jgi:dienelactone hydrolase
MTVSRLATLVCGAALAVAFHSGSARAELKKQWIDYKDGDAPLYGYLVYDDAFSGNSPGVLLVPSRAGMSQTALNDSDMIAKLGYVVFAEDIFGKGNIPKDTAAQIAQSAKYNQDRPLMRSRATAGFDVLKASPLVDASKLAVVGYCFGGTTAVELAETGVPIVGMVSVHGSFRNFSPEAAKNIKGRVLIEHGAEDEVAPLAEVNTLIDQLRAAKVDWQLDLYSGSSHGFTNPQNPSEQRADRGYKVASGSKHASWPLVPAGAQERPPLPRRTLRGPNNFFSPTLTLAAGHALPTGAARKLQRPPPAPACRASP